MSRITRALQKAQQESIPFRRSKLMQEIAVIITPVQKPFAVSFIYQGQDPVFRRFIGHFAAQIAVESPVRIVTDSPDGFSGFGVECLPEMDLKSGNCLLDNRMHPEAGVVFLVEKSDFCIYQNLPPEKVIGAIVIE
ncbi:MAG: hypothetical protein PHQ23_14555 [Candidatus Wallbacteria bacterium]|nr:hypothetical protein [Candidatus Wallbacteria bacterium]